MTDAEKIKKAKMYLRKAARLSEKLQILHRYLQLRKVYSQEIPNELEAQRQKIIDEVYSMADKILSLDSPYADILYLRFIEGKNIAQTEIKLEVSGRQLYRKQRDGLILFYEKYLDGGGVDD